MRQFLVFARKEIYHIARDRWTVLILLVLPILMIVLFGFGITTEVRNTRFAVYSATNDDMSQKIIDKLDQSEYFSYQGKVASTQAINDLFRKNKIGLVLVFEEQFEYKITHSQVAQIQLMADGTDPNTANTLVNYASNIILDFQREQSGTSTQQLITPRIKLMYNPSLKGTYAIVPGIMGMILMLICAMMTSISIAREKEMGTMEVLLASPMHPIVMILAKMLPYFILSLINLSTLLLLSVNLLEVPIQGNLFLLLFICIIFIFLSLTLGLLISTLVDKQITALLISGVVMILPIVYLSGMMFPIESMPILLQYISHIIPAKWFIIAIKDVMIKGLGIEYILKELAVLIGMATLLLVISLRKFKIRLE